MKPLSLYQAAVMCHGTLLHTSSLSPITSVVIDSRFVVHGSLFVALEGERVDGHDFISSAFALGAVGALIDEKHLFKVKHLLNKQEYALIVVKDTLVALQKLAHSYAQQFSHVKKVGITGSCGKTTTKEMLYSIMNLVAPTAKTPGNYNSLIGYSLSLFELDDTKEFGIFEMGVDHQGDMDDLLRLNSPDVALLTNIGLSHIGSFGDVRVTFQEKSNIFHPLIEQIFIHEQNPFTSLVDQTHPTYTTTYGPLNQVGIDYITSMEMRGYTISYKKKKFHLKAIGEHNLQNMYAAVAVARYLGASESDIVDGLEQFNPIEGRSRLTHGPITLIEDWYNSSVDSTRHILKSMTNQKHHTRTVALLGSMKELGDSTETSHRYIAQQLLKNNIDSVMLYGSEMESAYDELKKSGFSNRYFYTDDYDHLEHHVQQELRTGDLVLVKGSRAMNMERLVPVVQAMM